MKKNKKKIIIGVVCTAMAVGIIAAISLHKGPFKGTVKDVDGNPVANVSVTDGRHVVKTNENGEFRLSGWIKSHFVTITVPSGYKTEEFYKAVSRKTGSYDFTLEKSELTAQENHCFIQISDTEIGKDGTGEWLEALKETVKENNPAFLIHTGDICYEDGLRQHIKDMNTDTMGCTVKYIIGNHDYIKGLYGEKLFESIYGPVWYSFDVGKIHYVITPFQKGADYMSGYSANDRWRWLKNDLENVSDDMKVVIFNHDAPSNNYVLSFDMKEFDLKEHNLVAWVFGHYHYNYTYETDGILNISAPRPDCGGIDSSPAGTRIIKMNAEGVVSTDTVYYDLNESTEPQNALWSTQLSGNVLYCDTVLDGDFIYTATSDDDYPRECGVYCIDKENGNTVWFCKTKNSVKNNIKIQDEKLVAVDAEGNIYCLNKENGTLLWEKKLNLGNSLGTSSGLCIDNGIIYAGTSRVITALNLENGEKKWETVRDKGENSPAEFVVINGKLIVNSHWDALAALNLSNGKELWSNDDGDIRFRSSTPARIDDSRLLVADSCAIMIVNTDNGEIINKKTMEDYNFSSSGQPAIRDGIAYIPTANKGIVAFNIDSQEIVWSFETEESILFTAPYVGEDSKTVESSISIYGDSLVFGANDGNIYFVNIKDGTLTQKYFAGSAVLGAPQVSDEKIYAGAFNGYMVCYSLASENDGQSS